MADNEHTECVEWGGEQYFYKTNPNRTTAPVAELVVALKRIREIADVQLSTHYTFAEIDRIAREVLARVGPN